MTSRCVIDRLRPALAQAALSVYDDWEQDEDRLSEDLGSGGICQDIAAAMAVPARFYETGYGYVWRKRQGVLIDADCVTIDRVANPVDLATFRSLYGDELHPEVVDACPENSLPEL